MHRLLLAVMVTTGTATPSFAQTYTYDAAGRVVRAVYPDGKGVSYDYDEADNITSVLPVDAPAAPENLALAVPRSGAVRLSWSDRATNETGYVVQRRAAGDYGWQTVATLATNTTAYTEDGLDPQSEYVYRVQAAGVNAASSFTALQTVQPQLLASWLANISNRAVVGAGADILIPGFVISGSTPKTVLIRAIGPTLGEDPFNVPGVLPDPRLTIFDGSGQPLAGNDNWGSSQNIGELQDAFDRTGAFPLATDSKDAAVLITLQPGPYTVHAAGVNDATGVALVEVYDSDLDGTSSRLINISGRARVGVGADILIPGFVVDGEVNRRFLLRAVGPGLATPPFNVPGALSNPRLTLFRGSENLSANDNWSDAANADEIASTAAAVGAFPLAAGSADAALLIDLAPGAYTIHAAGVDGATGVAVVEVYEVQ